MSFSPQGLTPLIGVFDMPRALAFYRDVLGFAVVSASPEVETAEGRFSHWMWLRFGGAENVGGPRPTINPRKSACGKLGRP
jgi:glyoxylase I family protein